MFWLLLGLIFLAALFLWAAERPDTWGASQSQLRVGASVLLVFAALVGYGLYQESASRGRLEEILPVYPNATTKIWMPQVSAAKYWMLETEDGLDKVTDFYADAASESGWILTASEHNKTSKLKIEMPDLTVSLMASRKDDLTTLIYQVTGRR